MFTRTVPLGGPESFAAAVTVIRVACAPMTNVVMLHIVGWIHLPITTILDFFAFLFASLFGNRCESFLGSRPRTMFDTILCLFASTSFIAAPTPLTLYPKDFACIRCWSWSRNRTTSRRILPTAPRRNVSTAPRRTLPTAPRRVNRRGVRSTTREFDINHSIPSVLDYAIMCVYNTHAFQSAQPPTFRIAHLKCSTVRILVALSLAFPCTKMLLHM